MTTHTTQKMHGPHSKSQHRPPHDTPVRHPVRTWDSLFLHGLFHLSWLASFSRVFPSLNEVSLQCLYSRLSIPYSVSSKKEMGF